MEVPKVTPAQIKEMKGADGSSAGSRAPGRADDDEEWLSIGQGPTTS